MMEKTIILETEQADILRAYRAERDEAAARVGIAQLELDRITRKMADVIEKSTRAEKFAANQIARAHGIDPDITLFKFDPVSGSFLIKE